MRSVSGEQVIGWRAWKLRDDGLNACAVDYSWIPGDNHAHCLRDVPCPRAPGRGCQCGLWALHSPLRCFSRLRSDRTENLWVVGLMRAWGEVAIHSTEGFRAEHAAVACLFTDWPWDCPGPVHATAIVQLERLLHRFGIRGHVTPPDPSRERRLREAATGYGVPLLSVGQAVRSGLLSELGVSPTAVAEAADWARRLAEGEAHRHTTAGFSLSRSAERRDRPRRA